MTQGDLRSIRAGGCLVDQSSLVSFRQQNQFTVLNNPSDERPEQVRPNRKLLIQSFARVVRGDEHRTRSGNPRLDQIEERRQADTDFNSLITGFLTSFR